MTQCDQPVSGSDIYHKLGALEGKVDSLIARTAEYRTDLQVAFDRITAIENRMAWVMGGAIVISAIIPILMQIISQDFNVHIRPNEQPPVEIKR